MQFVHRSGPMTISFVADESYGGAAMLFAVVTRERILLSLV